MEEFDVTFHYIKGETNVVADALSRLAMMDDATNDEMSLMEESFEIAQDD